MRVHAIKNRVQADKREKILFILGLLRARTLSLNGRAKESLSEHCCTFIACSNNGSASEAQVQPGIRSCADKTSKKLKVERGGESCARCRKFDHEDHHDRTADS